MKNLTREKQKSEQPRETATRPVPFAVGHELFVHETPGDRAGLGLDDEEVDELLLGHRVRVEGCHVLDLLEEVAMLQEQLDPQLASRVRRPDVHVAARDLLLLVHAALDVQALVKVRERVLQEDDVHVTQKDAVALLQHLVHELGARVHQRLVGDRAIVDRAPGRRKKKRLA